MEEANEEESGLFDEPFCPLLANHEQESDLSLFSSSDLASQSCDGPTSYSTEFVNVWFHPTNTLWLVANNLTEHSDPSLLRCAVCNSGFHELDQISEILCE